MLHENQNMFYSIKPDVVKHKILMSTNCKHTQHVCQALDCSMHYSSHAFIAEACLGWQTVFFALGVGSFTTGATSTTAGADPFATRTEHLVMKEWAPVVKEWAFGVKA